MNKIFNFLILIVFLFSCKSEPEVEPAPCGYGEPVKTFPISFSADDGLDVMAEVYPSDAGFRTLSIVMLHQAGMNKKEYCSIAKKLAAMGYNCLTVDLRSGGNKNGFENETYNLATKMGMSTNYTDAMPELEKSIEYLYAKTKLPVIVWGSSYSAGLAIEASKNNARVKAVMAFSPGEYYGENYNLANRITGFNRPIFITSSKEEASDAKNVTQGVNQDKATYFVPNSKGTHGSKVLWESDPNNEEYWRAVESFLQNI